MSAVNIVKEGGESGWQKQVKFKIDETSIKLNLIFLIISFSFMLLESTCGHDKQAFAFCFLL